MNIDFVALCDAALETNGRLNVIGMIDYFWAAQTPYVYPQCMLAARVRFEPFEDGTFLVRVLVMDADGRAITERAGLPLTVRATEGDVPSVKNIVVQFRPLKLENYGPYGVHVEVGGKASHLLPFALVPPRNEIKNSGPKPKKGRG